MVGRAVRAVGAGDAEWRVEDGAMEELLLTLLLMCLLAGGVSAWPSGGWCGGCGAARGCGGGSGACRR